MRVLLKRNWFTAHGRFKSGVQLVPDALRDVLPKDATVLDDSEASAVELQEVVLPAPIQMLDDLKQRDEARAAADAEARVRREADEAEIEAKRLITARRSRRG